MHVLDDKLFCSCPLVGPGTHYFHEECLDRAVSVDSRCPTCRRELSHDGIHLRSQGTSTIWIPELIRCMSVDMDAYMRVDQIPQQDLGWPEAWDDDDMEEETFTAGAPDAWWSPELHDQQGEDAPAPVSARTPAIMDMLDFQMRHWEQPAASSSAAPMQRQRP